MPVRGTTSGQEVAGGRAAGRGRRQHRYLLPQVQYVPSVLAGLSWTQVAAAMRDSSSPVAKAVDGAANVITAAICTLTHGQPGGVCRSAGVEAAAGSL